MKHNYSAYTRGCRCAVCRRAKADYVAGRRRQARRSPVALVEGITHGRSGYEERGCRCETCWAARMKTRTAFAMGSFWQAVANGALRAPRSDGAA